MKAFESVLAWREEHVSKRMFTLILALLVGFFAAVAANVLHGLINLIAAALTGDLDRAGANWQYFLYPVVGILLTSLFVRYVVRDNISHGITRILYAISSKRSRLRAHNVWSSIVASAVTIGFGGSVGAEAPIVLTGSAIGSNLGRLFRMDNRTIMLLVGCGAAGAIAGIFKAPIAGLVFTLEVLMIDLTMSSLLPVLVACVTATCFTYIFRGSEALFTFTLTNEWALERVPANILLGVACGTVSLYFVRMMTTCENIFSRLAGHPYVRLVIGGGTLSLLIFLFPSLYGEGYRDINLLLNGNSPAEWDDILYGSLFAGKSQLLVIYIALVILMKVVATSATNGGGGCGGTFAPSLFVGCFTGFLFARLWNMYGLGIYVPEKNFALLGMAGVMAGVMQAPLTGIFLIAEITGGYDLFLPLMIVCVSSYLTMHIFEPHSIYGMRLAKQGKLITHHTDHAVLTLMDMGSVIVRDVVTCRPEADLSIVLGLFGKSQRDLLPVTDAAGRLLGEVDLYRIRHIIFRTELYHHFTAEQLMTAPSTVLSENMSMVDVMSAFDATRSDGLPVLDSDDRLIGYIARDRVYALYRTMVADMSEE